MALPISVGICTRNRDLSLGNTLATVLATDPSEVVIVDQSDTDATRLLVESLNDPRLKYHHSSVPGLSRAYNKVVSLASHEYVAFTDDDCTVPSDWLEVGVGLLDENPKVSMIYGQVLAGEVELEKGDYIPELKLAKVESFTPGGHFRVLGMGANFVARASAIMEVGGFDDLMGGGGKFKSSQDFDMQFRLWRAGHTVLAHPGLFVLHYGLRTHQEWPHTARAYGYGDGAFYLKHVKLKDFTAMRLLAKVVLKETARPLVRKARRHHYRSDYASGFASGFRAALKHPVDARTRRYRADDQSDIPLEAGLCGSVIGEKR